MAQIEITIPAMGEGITEASINKLMKNIGDLVEEDDVIAEIATDKVDSEIVAPKKGIIKKLLINEGETAKVGQVIIIIDTAESETELKKAENREPLRKKLVVDYEQVDEKAIIVTDSIQASDILHTSNTPSGKFLSPLVRSMAKTENISLEELDKIPGTGAGNRLTKDDLISYIFSKNNQKKSLTATALADKIEPAPKLHDHGYEIIEMDRMRRLIADHMIDSKKTSAHVTSFIDVDVSNIVVWRNKIKIKFEEKYNEKITYTPVFIEAIVQAIKEFPMINVSVENNTILRKKNINIGMATALPNGNLIVPVIKGTSDLNLLGITKRVNDLANRARNNKLKPDEIQGGTFTMTNLGTFGNLTGTPIINQPEVAILAVGAIKKKPVVIENPQGDTIGIRHIMILSMSYDHRVVDGAHGGMFIKRVADLLEGFDPDREI